METDTDRTRYDELYHIRNEIVDWALIACSAIGIIAQIFATLRIFYVGFSLVIIFQNISMLLILLITIFRKRINLNVKTAFVLFILYTFLISGFVRFGFLASSKVYLIIAPIFSTFILGFRKTFIVVFLSLIIYVFVGIMFTGEIFIYDFDIKKYIINPNSWMMDGSILIATSIAIMILGNRYSAALISKISDFKIRNREISDNENRYRTLFENTNDGIAIMKDEAFIFSNKRMSDIFKSGVDEFIGKTPADFSPEYQPDGMESKTRMNEFINKALSDQPQRFEWLHKQLNGELFNAEVSLNKIILKGETLIQTIVRDISEKKQIERKILKAIVEAEEREREKFARELHDGLGPLCSTIKLYAQSAQNENDSKARESVLAIINDTISEAISSLSDISNSISPHILHNFGLISAVHAFVDNIKSTRKVNISCSSNTKERFQDIIEYTVYRVLVELINNAIKNAVAKNITIRIEKADDILDVLYRDDGKGTVIKNVTDEQTGMFNIRNRIKSLNGQITIDEDKHKGLMVNIIINLEDNESFNN